MKKIIIITWTIALILFYSTYIDKVKAEAVYYDGYSAWYNSTGTALGRTGDYSFIQYTGTSNTSQWHTFYLNSNQSASFVNTSATYMEYQIDISVLYSGQTALSYTTQDFTTCQLASSISQVGTDDYEYRYTSFTCPTNDGQIDTYTQQMSVSFLPRIYYGNGNWSVCNIKTCINTTCSVSCHLNQHKSSGISRVEIQWNTNNFNSMSGSYTVRTSLSRPFTLYKSMEDLIQDQTDQQQQQYNEDHTYDNTPSQEINGTNELNDYSSQEDQLMNSLDFNMTIMDGITINPQASAFIWNVADRLRGINAKIILLMTSILGLGIIKMILNR